MTGRERFRRIRLYINGRSLAQVQQFMAGTLRILPCSGDAFDDLVIAELDRATGPLQLGLWFWEH